MVSLNADIMSKILDYLDHPTLALVAQTNKAWRLVTYRTSLWQVWLPKMRAMEYFATDLAIPRDSHHNGTPTLLCFYSWIAYKLHHNILQDLPHKVVNIENPVQFLDKVYEYWIRFGKPCIHTNHHKWSHVFKYYHLIKNISSADIKRIGFRITEFPTPMTHNPYRSWLAAYVNSLPPIRIGSLPEMTSTDLLSVVYYKSRLIEVERLKELSKRQEAFCARLTASIQALTKIPTTEFHANEKYFEKHGLELLNAIVFSMPQDHRDLATATATATATQQQKEEPNG